MDPLGSGYSPRKVLKRSFEDRISQLPDDIIVSILSLLTLREAAATSLISRRWRYVWTYVRQLEFDESSLMLKSPSAEVQKFLKLEPFKYVRWVNSVVRSHRGSSIDHFRVIIHCGMHKNEVYEWISFAVTKRAERLELEFSKHHYSEFTDQFYACIHSNPSGISLIKPLKTLRLSYAFVTGELLEFLLSNCPQLTILEVSRSPGLVKLRIGNGAFLRLQHLRISYCYNLKSLEIINAPDLVSFAYHGPTTEFHVQNVPSLCRVYLGSMQNNSPRFAFVSLAKFLSELEWLEIKVAAINFGYNLQFPHGELTKLKHLSLDVIAFAGESLLGITGLIESAPSLEKFVLKLMASSTRSASRGTTPVRKLPKRPLYCLKEVEFVGFRGYRPDLELGRYLLENAVMLEKFVINICCPVSIGSAWEDENTKEKACARKHAKKLEMRARTSVNFRIIN